MAKHNTGGWFKQSLRHSKARKYGKAGGTYATRVITILKKHPEYKNLSFKELKGKGIFLKYQADYDEDGVKNIKDCKPLNPKEQDLKETATKVGAFIGKEAKAVGGWVGKEAKIGYAKTKLFVEKEKPKVEAWVKKEATAVKGKIKEEYETYKQKRKEAVAKAVAQATQRGLIDEQTAEQQEELVDKLSEIKQEQESTEMSHEIDNSTIPKTYPDLDVSHIFLTLQKPEIAQKTAEQTSKAFTKAQHRNVEELANVDVKELSDEELKTITIRLGTGFWGQGNKFENEIKRRIREREKVETDLKIELEKAQLESNKRLETLRAEYKEKETGGGQSFWEYISSSPEKRNLGEKK
jgi:hypothetical protein